MPYIFRTILFLLVVFSSCKRPVSNNEYLQKRLSERNDEEQCCVGSIRNDIQDKRKYDDEYLQKRLTQRVGEGHRYLECPKETKKDDIIVYEGMTVSYNVQICCPNWVAYELTKEEVNGNVSKRDKKTFVQDLSYKGKQADFYDFKNTNWEKGHLAPAADMKWSWTAMNECFYFTNCCPQHPDFNGGVWEKLENKTRAIARQYGRVYVVTGPIVGKNVNGTIGENRVVVPDAFFKAWLVPVNGTYSAIGFVLYNSPEDQDISASACTIDELELLTGFDFYHNLDDKTEKHVEASIDWKYWKGVGIVP